MKVVAVFWALVVRVSSTGGQDSRRWSDIPHVLDGAQIETDVTHRVPANKGKKQFAVATKTR
jgi:hypothetical protein